MLPGQQREKPLRLMLTQLMLVVDYLLALLPSSTFAIHSLHVDIGLGWQAKQVHVTQYFRL